jgi:hypothetical protein
MFIGIKIFLNGASQLRKIKPYMDFKFSYPENVGHKKFLKYWRELIEYDPITVPDDKKLEYIVARMRNMNFPEGVAVEYKGKKLTV